jgi:hypothetical protein
MRAGATVWCERPFRGGETDGRTRRARAPAISPRLDARERSPEAILALQRAVGNRRTTSVLTRWALQRAPVETPQPPPQSGLVAPAETAEFAVKAVEFARDRPDVTPAQLVEFIAALALGELAEHCRLIGKAGVGLAYGRSKLSPTRCAQLSHGASRPPHRRDPCAGLREGEA